jgi:NTE family protein
LRHVINQLVEYVPADARGSACVKELASYGCHTRMHVVRLLAPRLHGESHTKDVDFSPRALRMRREAGYETAMRALRQAQWAGVYDPLEAVVVHEPALESTMAE